ncbi:hypothetical protein DER29_5961 [Micromonospora sp. M71_S20]|uniref:hypothetical protein n=1 Tax=Micromonospora sp. M71_S20 TaxID=592872 RepID=UPI000F18E350|nr:hypothetical protein [Micromonospora sp. M71_S20]RLK12677.1 hypothetical protein DER29_5961 [Micromonospora sp. M71_S20]
MSRHNLTPLPHRIDHKVSVGWDRPLTSYFAVVLNHGETDETSPDALPVWLGAMERVTDPDEVIEAVRPYAHIPDTLRIDLEADRDREGSRVPARYLFRVTIDGTTTRALVPVHEMRPNLRASLAL